MRSTSRETTRKLLILGPLIYFYPVFFPLSIISRTGSVWTLIATTVDRYLAICRPLFHKRTKSGSRMQKILLAIGISAILFNLNRFFEIDIRHCAQLNLDIMTPSALRMSKTYHLINHLIMNFSLVRMGPFIIQTMLTIMIIRQIR